MAPKIDFRVGVGRTSVQPLLRHGAAEAQEYLFVAYPVMVASSGWTEGLLFRDVYGSHRWIFRRWKIGSWEDRDGLEQIDYLFGPALGAAEAKSLAIDLLYRLNNRERPGVNVRKPVVIATCDHCGAHHVWSGVDGYGQDRDDYRPLWCWGCHNHGRSFTVLP